MNLVPRRVGHISVLTPTGRIDHTSADAFGAGLAPHVDACTRDGAPVVLDMSGVDYMSSVGLRALMIAARQVKSQGGRMVVASLTPIVLEVFHISRFHLVFELFDSVDAALVALGSPQ